MHRIALLLAATAAVVVLPVAPSRAVAGPSVPLTAHPYFDDQGTLAWYGDLGAAQDAARASGRLLFIEYGRRACGNCKTLVSRVLPAPAVRTRLSAACVGLAADCDEPDPRVEAVFRRAMPDASLLPFVAVVSPDLDYVTGWQGSMDVAGCCVEIGKIETWRDRNARRATVVTKPPKAAPSAPAHSAPTDSTRPRSATTPPAAPLAVTSPANASATAPQVRSTAPPPACGGAPVFGGQAAALAAARELLRQAEAASGAGRHAEALGMDREAAGLSIRVDPSRWSAVIAAADAWAEGLLAEAVTAAVAGRDSDAEARLAVVRRDVIGRGASIDAERGTRALAMRRLIASASASVREKAALDARTAFRGTRWAALFAA